MKPNPLILSFILVIQLFTLSVSAHEAPLIFSDKAHLKGPSKDSLIRVAVWNVLKAERSGFNFEFEKLRKTSDLMLLQEVSLNQRTLNAFESQEFEWVMAESTGTAIMTRFHHHSPRGVLSRDGQPITNTPKSSTLIKVPVQGVNLLVVSTHAINFTLNGPFERQLKALAREIAAHDGPILWAGDFNTWNRSRRNLLFKLTAELGLTAAPVINEPRSLILDHAFTRGLHVDGLWVLDNFTSSDHWPLYLTIKLLTQDQNP
jgi:endonuclease/exonuclease/phosphatase (EEP) superfamily protein YafD